MSRHQPKPDDNSLSVKQFQAIENLMLGKTITATAAAVGVNRRTLHRWLERNHAFQAALARRRAGFVAALDNRLTERTPASPERHPLRPPLPRRIP